MRILYYDWDEFNGEDCRDAMKRLGHEVETIRLDQLGGDLTPETQQEFKWRFDRRDDSGKRYFDLVYSFDYFPSISEVCQKYEIKISEYIFAIVKYLLYTFVCVLTCDFVTSNVPGNLMGLFIRIGICFVIVFMLTCACFFRKEEFQEIKSRIKSLGNSILAR